MISLQKAPIMLSLLVALPGLTAAQTPVETGNSTAIEELLVIGETDTASIKLDSQIDIGPDAAQLLRHAPGSNVNGNGPVTGIQQYRGMYGSRVAVGINNTQISAGGPNWMDPPLSYLATSQLESVNVYRGIAPVSAAQESIGGLINAKSKSIDFTKTTNYSTSGELNAGTRSANSSNQTSALLGIANRFHALQISGVTEAGDDADFADGEIGNTEYQRTRHDALYRFKTGRHQFSFSGGRVNTSEAGTPALPMDIDYIDSDLYNIGYTLNQSNLSLHARAYGSTIEHGMTNYHLRSAPMMTAMWRRNIAEGDNRGIAIKLALKDAHGESRLGIDSHKETHDSNIDNPNNPMFFVTNFNNVERQVSGIYAERIQRLNAGWSAELGLRANRVAMDADPVNATPAMPAMGMPAATQLRDNFNNSDRDITDNNQDLVAKVYLDRKRFTYYLGIGQKTRSPSYQERYLWLPLQATGGLADGFTYTGNIDLDPETSRQLEFGFDFSDNNFRVSPRVFYQNVDDYIQGTVSGNMPAVMFSNMMMGITPLEFNNVEATIWGFDTDYHYQLNDAWSLNGVINIVRGERDDIDDYLYRIAPDNGRISFNYQANTWGLSINSQFYDKQDRVSETNGEQETAGYSIFGLSGYWHAGKHLRLSGGINNLLDKNYRDHLGGVNRVSGSDVAVGERLPGYGREFFARIDVSF